MFSGKRKRGIQGSRPHWAAGMYLTAEACTIEQEYRLERGRRHNRQLHGSGVVCGLWVVPAADAARPWAVGICPGYAIGPYGDEIELRDRAEVDIAAYLWAEPSAPVLTHVPQRRVLIAVRYLESGDALRVLPGALCGCDEPEYVPSRIRDGYEAVALWTFAATRPPARDICAGPAECPPCPDSPWLALARVTLPAGPAQLVTTNMIDNGIRTVL